MKVSLPPLTSPKKFNATAPAMQNSPLTSPKWQYNTNNFKKLDHHIKMNDVSQFLGENKIFVGEDKKDEDVSVDEKKELIQNLLHIRKRLNEVKEECEKKTVDSNKMKREVDKMKLQEENSQDVMTNNHDKLDQLKLALQYQKAKTEEVTHAQSVYNNMLDRLKKDKLADQIKINHLEDEYTSKYHDLTLKLEEVKQNIELHSRAKSFAHQVQKQVHYETQLRLENLQQLEHSLTAREEYDHKKEERSEHIQRIADNAAAEVDDDQKSWNELFLSHKFLEFFLKNKIDKQIKKYETSEKAFQLIKAGTGLNDLNEIVRRFLEREKTYSELLVSIADLERKVTRERKANDELKTRVNESREQGMELEKQIEEKHSIKGLVSTAQKELYTKSSEEKVANLVLERVYRWSVRTMTRVDRAQNIVKNTYTQEYPQDKTPAIFVKLVEAIQSNLNLLKEKEGDPNLSKLEKFNVDFAMMTRDFTSKNVRVRPNYGRVTAEVASQDLGRGMGSKANLDLEVESAKDEVKTTEAN